jgi:hypothetical protein
VFGIGVRDCAIADGLYQRTRQLCGDALVILGVLILGLRKPCPERLKIPHGSVFVNLPSS